MQAAVLAMQTRAQDTADPVMARALAAQEAEARHALAIAEALPEAGFSPCLICGRDSPLVNMPTPIPRLCLGTGIAASLRLWQWQRQRQELLIIAVGDASLKMARALLRMGKKDTRKLIGAFFLLPPARDNAKILDQARLLAAGSQFIIDEIAQIPHKTEQPRQVIAPGIDIEAYGQKAAPWQEGRFVFGMDASLMPHSGALLLVRAMSALWQHEDIPPWEARMFGGGPRFEEIMEEAEKLGVLPRLALLADQPLPVVAPLCHVWLAPGTAPDEMPQTLWAGFAAGLPVICADSAPHKARVFDAGAVLSVPPDNPQSMARAMLSMLRDADLRQNKAGAGYALRPEISLEGMAKRFCAIVRDFSGHQGSRNVPQAGERAEPDAGRS